MYGIEIFIVNIVILAIALSVWLGTSETSTKAVTYKSHDGTYVAGSFNTDLKLYHADQTTDITLSATAGDEGFIAKYDKDGSVKWAAKQNGTGNDKSQGVSTDRSGNVYVCGYYDTDLKLYNSDKTPFGTTLSGTNTTDGFIAKYDKDGTVVWAAKQTGAGSDYSNSVSTDKSGNVYVAGSYDTSLTLHSVDQTTVTTLSGSDTRDGFIAKYDKDGTVQWAARQTGTGDEYSYGVSTDRSGNVYVAGRYNTTLTLHSADQTAFKTTLSATAGTEGFIAKYDKDGTVKWAAKQTGTASNDFSRGVSTDRNGNVYVAGYYNTDLTLHSADQTAFDTTLSGTDYIEGFIAKYDKDGTVKWAAKQNGTSYDYSRSVSTDRSGNVYVSGSYNTDLTLHSADQTAFETTLSGTDTTDGFLAKYDKDGKVKWAAKQTGAGSDYSNSVSTDRSGNIYVSGHYGTDLTLYSADQTEVTTLSATDNNEGFIAKYDKDGTVQWAAKQTGAGSDVSPSVSSYYYLEEVQ